MAQRRLDPESTADHKGGILDISVMGGSEQHRNCGGSKGLDPREEVKKMTVLLVIATFLVFAGVDYFRRARHGRDGIEGARGEKAQRPPWVQ